VSLVRPNFEYAAAAWDPYTAKDIQQLERVQPKYIYSQRSIYIASFAGYIYTLVQRRAARFVKKDYRHTTSVTGLLDELGWLSLFERRKHSRLTVFIVRQHTDARD